ncbi:MAG: aspartate aminotransferase family protein [Phycisphaerae bacterium]|nr:aspartate aminotransferase family protein [Phycisphaerae bacterium]
MNTQEILDLFDKYVIGNYGRTPVAIVRGEGSTIWDADGKRYLDFFPGWGCSLLGHCHPHIVEAIREQAGMLLHMDNTFYIEPQGKLAEWIATRGFGGKSFFCNSGAEAIEAAIKLARKATPEGRYKIVTMEKSFHGRTFGAMSATAQAKTRAGFAPLLAGFEHVPFGDIDAVKNVVDDETAGILLEPIQGEGGVNVPPDGYLSALRELCDDRGMLLLFDEVQTGCGRTGKWFGHQHDDVVPDIMALAKAVGGGTSLGAICAKPEVADHLTPGSHASTYGGNPLVTAAGVAMFEIIERDNLLARATEIEQYVFGKVEQLKSRFSFIESSRGRGVMIGIQLSIDGTGIVGEALKRGLRVNCTQQTVLRMLPAMTITNEQIDEGFQILADAMSEATKTAEAGTS